MAGMDPRKGVYVTGDAGSKVANINFVEFFNDIVTDRAKDNVNFYYLTSRGDVDDAKEEENIAISTHIASLFITKNQNMIEYLSALNGSLQDDGHGKPNNLFKEKIQQLIECINDGDDNLNNKYEDISNFLGAARDFSRINYDGASRTKPPETKEEFDKILNGAAVAAGFMHPMHDHIVFTDNSADATKTAKIDFHDLLNVKIKDSGMNFCFTNDKIDDGLDLTATQIAENDAVMNEFETQLLGTDKKAAQYLQHIHNLLPEFDKKSSGNECEKVKMRLKEIINILQGNEATYLKICAFEESLEKINELYQKIKTDPDDFENFKANDFDHCIAQAALIIKPAAAASTTPIIIDSEKMDSWDELTSVFKKVANDLNMTNTPTTKYEAKGKVDDLALIGGDSPKNVDIKAKRSDADGSKFTLTLPPTEANLDALKRIIDEAPNKGLNMKYIVRQCPDDEAGLKQVLKMANENADIKFSQEVIEKFTDKFGAASTAPAEWATLKAIFDDPSRVPSTRANARL